MKTIVFVSDFLEHHTYPLCDSFLKIENIQFFYVATMPTPKARLALGYEDMNELFDFVIPAYKGKSYKKQSYEILLRADLVLFGGVWGKYSKFCFKHKIPTMRITERFLKGNNGVIKKALKILKYKHLARFEKNALLLCCGKYAAKDFSLTNKYFGRMLKFGYFPKIDLVENQCKKKEHNSIVWAGRFLDWKHPEHIIALYQFLISKNISFSINVIGDGPLFNTFKAKIESDQTMKNHIHLHGALNYRDVRKIMNSSEIHIFTSDSNEGWGAVLNESMSSSCIPIVNYEIGASTYLINDGVNGFLYHNLNEFCDLVYKYLTSDKCTKEDISSKAFATIENSWNSNVCANRIIEMLSCCKNGNFCLPTVFNDGPLSMEIENV